MLTVFDVMMLKDWGSLCSCKPQSPTIIGHVYYCTVMVVLFTSFNVKYITIYSPDRIFTKIVMCNVPEHFSQHNEFSRDLFRDHIDPQRIHPCGKKIYNAWKQITAKKKKEPLQDVPCLHMAMWRSCIVPE